MACTTRAKTRIGNWTATLPLLLTANGVRRTDDRFFAPRLGFDIPVSDRFTVENAIDYTSVDSNLETAAFDEVGYSVKLAAAF